MSSVGKLDTALQGFPAKSRSFGLTGTHYRLTIEQLAKTGLGLALAAIVGGLLFWTWTDFVDARDTAVSKVSAAALVIEEHAQRSLLTVDAVLGAVTELVAERGFDALDSEAGWKELRRIASPLPKTGAIFVVNRAAKIVLATPSHPPPNADVTDREWVKLIMAGKEDFHIGRALQGRSVHNIFFPIARSIRSRDGTLIGAAQVGLEATYISQLFSNLDLGADAHLRLYGTRDGAIVAAHPLTEALLEKTAVTEPFFSMLANSEAYSWIGWMRRNGAEHIVSARRLNGLPLIVSASLPKHQVYAESWRRLLWHAAAAAFTVIGLSVLTGLIVRIAKRERVLAGELDHRVKNISPSLPPSSSAPERVAPLWTRWSRHCTVASDRWLLLTFS